MGLLPIEKVEYGINYACFIDGGERYICSCQRKSIENRMRLFEGYFCRFGYYDIMTEISYDAHDPDLKRIVLGLPPSIDEKIDYDGDILSQIKFKPHICHNCNEVPARFLSAAHPKSKKYRNLPYKINTSISFGVYPSNKMPPKKGRHYFFLDEAKMFPAIKNCTFSGALLNGLWFRKCIKIGAFIEKIHGLSEDEQRKLMCVPNYFKENSKNDWEWSFLFSARRSLKCPLNNVIENLLNDGADYVAEIQNEDTDAKWAIYDYELCDGKIYMDKLLEPFFRTDLEIYLKYAAHPDSLGFCYKIFANNQFYNAIKNTPVQNLTEAIEFVPNLIEDADKLQKIAESTYFKLLANGMQLGVYSNIVLFLSDKTDKMKSMSAFFDFIESNGLHNEVSPIISAFYKKDLNLSYYDVKEKYADLLFRIVTFTPTRLDSPSEEIYKEFLAQFSDKIKGKFTKKDYSKLYVYLVGLLVGFDDGNRKLRLTEL